MVIVLSDWDIILYILNRILFGEVILMKSQVEEGQFIFNLVLRVELISPCTSEPGE